MTKHNLGIPEEIILRRIYIIRGLKVMIDRDLAELYQVETKALKQAVKRNLHRFPVDFMFELTKSEFENWRRQFGTSNSSDKMGLRYLPYVFTEHGVLMLSSVLSSEKAVEVNIQIMRIFTKIKQSLSDNTELRLEIEKIKRKTENNSKNIEEVFQYIDELLDKKEDIKPRIQIGYKKSE